MPQPGQTVPPPPTGADFDVPGITPIVVANDAFYQIDTRLGTPHIDQTTWSLRIHGMVDREVTLTYDQLVAMPLVEQYVTIACVSNEVGGHLVGNAKWTGVNLNSVLATAGVQPGATQVVGRAYDGWTSGFPTEHLSGAGKDAMIVVLMNGEPLPARHGFPARLIIPGLYGYVSATKWITEIELTTLEAFDAYWINLGWAKEGPILTQSRIDTPRSGEGVGNGPVQIAGVAWAPTRGISKVEINLDDGDSWHACELCVATVRLRVGPVADNIGCEHRSPQRPSSSHGRNGRGPGVAHHAACPGRRPRLPRGDLQRDLSVGMKNRPVLAHGAFATALRGGQTSVFLVADFAAV